MDCIKEIYAGIVTFNPDIDRLKKNISSIVNQVPLVKIFDNGSKNIEEIKQLISNYQTISIIESETNVGIATALNNLMQYGNDNEYKWMLTLDQDSVCNNSYVKTIYPYLNIEERLGIVAPVIVDKNVGVIGHNSNEKYIHVNTCITSGSVVNVESWKQIGEYDEKMFIDSVDFEFCYRMRKYGYGVIQVPEIKLEHELGNTENRKFLFWNIQVNGHSAFRKYYIAKNNIYYPLKHHLYLYVARGCFRNLKLIGIVLLYEGDKKNKINNIFKGWKDGFVV